MMTIANLMFLTLLACQTQGIENIDNAQLQALLKDEEVQLVDVRTPEEWSYGQIEGAEKIDFYDPEFLTKLEEFDKDKPLVLYCAAGGRSAQAASKLQNTGFKKIYNLSGGFRGWSAAGLPTVK